MKFEFSAGGIVYRHEKPRNGTQSTTKSIYVLVAQHSQHHGWVFPKGLIGKKETKEDAALREVKEETGIAAKIIKPLTPITYWYNFEGEKVKKTVYYFLMEYVAGDIKNHDFEMENVEWLPIDEVEKRLTYGSDKRILKEAKRLVVSL